MQPIVQTQFKEGKFCSENTFVFFWYLLRTGILLSLPGLWHVRADTVCDADTHTQLPNKLGVPLGRTIWVLSAGGGSGRGECREW